MDTIEAMLSRVSCPRLRDPGPDDSAIETLVRCALRAPDHGNLRPGRYVVFRGAGRAALGELFAAAESRRNPHASIDALEKLRHNPLRAPVVIACAAKVTPGHKVPRIEQVASVAAAVQNMQLAADALGFGAMWRTGPMATDPSVKAGLGFGDDDEIVAFLYVGTVDGERRRAELPATDAFVAFRDGA